LSLPSWRRLSVVSAVCAVLAVLVSAPSPWLPFLSSYAVSFGYAGIWLGGMLGLVAIGTGGATFIRDMRNRALDIPLAVFGLLAGIPCVLWALWILGLTIGGGMGE
jgi:energy-converting hydrogenase Eha subunit G